MSGIRDQLQGKLCVKDPNFWYQRPTTRCKMSDNPSFWYQRPILKYNMSHDLSVWYQRPTSRYDMSDRSECLVSEKNFQVSMSGIYDRFQGKKSL